MYILSFGIIVGLILTLLGFFDDNKGAVSLGMALILLFLGISIYVSVG